MPVYTHLCQSCGYRFKRMAKFEAAQNPAKCECGEMAGREMPATASSVVQTAVTGPSPQNTGFASLDAHIDRVIGQSSEMGWQHHENRQTDKDQAALSEGVAPGQRDVMYQEADGSWRVMSEGERAASRKVADLNKKAMSVLNRRERKLSSDGPRGR